MFALRLNMWYLWYRECLYSFKYLVKINHSVESWNPSRKSYSQSFEKKISGNSHIFGWSGLYMYKIWSVDIIFWEHQNTEAMHLLFSTSAQSVNFIFPKRSRVRTWSFIFIYLSTYDLLHKHNRTIIVRVFTIPSRAYSVSLKSEGIEGIERDFDS
jgi:hypothetical protein